MVLAQFSHDNIFNCIDLIDGAYIKNIAKKKGFQYNDSNKPPWSWFGEQSVYFHVLEYNWLCSLAKKILYLTHDSSLVSDQFQRLGIGTELLNCMKKKQLR